MDRGVYYTKHDREFVLRNKDKHIKKKTQPQQNFFTVLLRIKYTSYIYIQKKIHREQCSTGGEIEGEYNKTKQGTIYIYIYYRTLTKYILLRNDGKIYTYIYIIKQRKI